MSNPNSGPVCHIPTGQASSQQQQPQPVKLPVIPPAIDLPSALNAINQMRLVLQLITGQKPTQKPRDMTNPNIAMTQNLGVNQLTPLNQSIGTPKLGRFKEDKNARVVNIVNVTGAKIARVDQVVFVDDVTGELLVWKR